MDQEQVWNKIAKAWNEYRKRPYPWVVEFLKNKKGKILDLGCGSGRHLIKSKAKFYCVDFSEKLLKYAKSKAKKQKIDAKFVKSKAYNLPFEDNFFDSVIYIATIHCLKGKNREKSLKELKRVLKKKGKAMISTWGRKQERIKNKAKESLIPWTINKKKYYRYCYIFDEKEFVELLKKVGFKIKKVVNEKNLIIIVEK